MITAERYTGVSWQAAGGGKTAKKCQLAKMVRAGLPSVTISVSHLATPRAGTDEGARGVNEKCNTF
jgi:hypothetical protein